MNKPCPVCGLPMKKVEDDQEVVTSKHRAGSGNFFSKTGSGGEASGSDARMMEKWWACSNCGTAIPA